MVALGSFLAGLALLGLIGELIRRGFRDGDRPGDVRVAVGSIIQPEGARGAWTEIRVENPGEQIALVGVLARRSHLGGPDARGAASRRANRRLGRQDIGAVEPGGGESFWVWTDRANRRSRVIVTVGTSGRLRRHSLGLGHDRAAPEAAPVPVPLKRSPRPGGGSAVGGLI